MVILDCTFRDGGYYTDWNFDDDLVKKSVEASLASGVDIIELGYKSKGNKYKVCDSKELEFLPKTDKYAFMIDLKEYIPGGSLDGQLDLIEDAGFFTYVRIATAYENIKYLKDAADILRNKGYEVIVNLMSISLVRDYIGDICKWINEVKPHAFYFADSLGGLYPEQVKEICSELYGSLECPIGFHAHENQGLAFANAMVAMENGAEFIDATIRGMGRGAGNLRLEQLLVYEDKYVEPILKVSEDGFKPLQERFRWGYSPSYQLAGQYSIHPSYVQQYNDEEDKAFKFISELVASGNKSKFEKNLLPEPKSVVIIPARYKSSRFPGKPLAEINGKPMLLYVCEIAEAAVGAENVYVATDDERIARTAKTNGFKYVMTDDALTGTDRVAQAAKQIEADIYINVQGDEPTLDYKDILKIIEFKKQDPFSVYNAMCKIKNEDPRDTNIPKVITGKDNKMLYMSRSAIPGSKEYKNIDFYKQVCIYAFTKKELELFNSVNYKSPSEEIEDIEILRYELFDYPVKMIEAERSSIAVDLPQDIERVENYLKDL